MHYLDLPELLQKYQVFNYFYFFNVFQYRHAADTQCWFETVHFIYGDGSQFLQRTFK
ncbi:hypothetical protein SAMN05428959_10131 [Duganella sp. CF517]|nr:hypothetical protein SAMN05428959_10131 [Duganella sp. CF517]